MEQAALFAKAKIQISKPVSEVFEAVAAPDKISGYFLAASTARLENGAEPLWTFPEFSDQFPVRVIETETDKLIRFAWDDKHPQCVVEIKFEPASTTENNDATIVTVTEGPRGNDEAGLKWMRENTEGWANFLACLKAYTEYGINLRNGAFDFMQAQ